MRSIRRLLPLAVLACLLASASAAQAAPDTVIVKYRSGTSTAERVSLFERTGVSRTVGSVRGTGAKLVRVGSSSSPSAVAQRLDRSSRVLYAEPNRILRAEVTPNDARFTELYGFSNTGQTSGSSNNAVGIVLSTKRGGGYVAFSGTSMATPHAAGVAARLWSQNPTQTAAGVRSLLGSRVDDLGATGRDSSFGFGRVNLCLAAGGSCTYTGGG